MASTHTRALDLPLHPRFAGFEAFAQREIMPWLAKNEETRRQALRRATKTMLITLAVIAVLQAITLGIFGMNWIASAVIFGGGPAFLGFAIAGMPLVALRNEMKSHLLPKICERLKLDYLGKAPGFPFQAFVDAGMLPHYDKHSLEDGIASDEAGIWFTAAEAHLSVRKRTKNGTRQSKVWGGVLFAARTPRPFKGLTLLMPERGFIARLFGGRDATRLTLGLGDLEAGLEIRSTLPEEARHVLTERLMRRLRELREHLDGDQPSLALVGEHVLVAVRSNKNRFEGGSLFKRLDDPARVEALLREFGDLFELADALGQTMRLERAGAQAPGAVPR